MTIPAHHRRWMAGCARALLGAVLFLVVMSYLALPCMTRDAAQFQSVGAANACSQHDVFKPLADVPKLLTMLTAERAFDLPLAAAASSLPVAILLLLPSLHARLRKRRRPRGPRLPFSTAEPPKLAAFAALRDA